MPIGPLPDRLRPLSPDGERRAALLAGVLVGLGARRLFSSPFRRCVQTLEPLAARIGVPVETSEDAAQGAGLRVLDLARRAGEGAVLCTHGDVVNRVVGHIARHRGLQAVADADPGAMWRIELRGEEPVGATFFPPPALPRR